MPKVTEEYLEARRQQVLKAACACFSGKGFHQTTMQDICREAHLSPGAVYRYFRSKEEIIQAMVEECRQQSTSLIEEAKGCGSTWEVLGNLADAFFSLLDPPEAQSIARLRIELWAEALHSPAVMTLLRRDLDGVHQVFSQIVLEGQQQGDLHPALEPGAVARVLISLFDGLLLQKALGGKVDVLKYVAVVKAMGCGLLCPGQAPELDEVGIKPSAAEHPVLGEDQRKGGGPRK